MEFYRHWDEIKNPTAAERKLKAALEGGWPCELGPADKIPPAPDDWSNLDSHRHIRADVLRFLLVHARKGAVQSHERGLMLRGAYISGQLNLDYCKIPLRTDLRGCRFEYGIHAERSDWAFGLRLSHCAAPLLNGTGCKIGGQLVCEGAEFNATKGNALNLQGAEIQDSLVFALATLNSAAHLAGLSVGGQLDCHKTKFLATEGLSLNLQGTNITQSLFLSSATFTSAADLVGLCVGGSLDCNEAHFSATKGFALRLQGAEIKGGVFLRGLKPFAGILDLTGAKTSTLVEDADSIQMLKEMSLDGFTYDRIAGPTDAKTRLRWLEHGDDVNGEFAPQPYKQLAKVLHDMGHEGDAREVLYTLERKLGQERRKRVRKEIRDLRNTAPATGLAISKHLLLGADLTADWLQRITIGYGRKPFRSLAVLAVLLVSFWIATIGTWYAGDFAPNSAQILRSEEWRDLDPDHYPDAANHWADTSPTGRDWESFHSLAYAADVVIPIIEFGQTDAWAPSTERGPAGYHLWWLRWLFTILGWIVTALGAAALTGIIRRE